MSRIAKAFAITAVTGSAVVAGAGLAVADAGAHGAAVGSPGVLSGNLLQVPVHVPVNVCGNTVNVIGLLNPAFGNTCVNASGGDNHHTEGAGYGH
ncbi:chaplin [Streptomyces erythrochromogenes]|uniref:chaplin n=1 Tax=Streptomyces erythrochromogenes TaxID=285574 RepID=UPI0036ABBEDE